MNTAQNIQYEVQRLNALYAVDILDTPSEERFDQITQFVSSFFDTPICLISLVDRHRQWFKSKHGLDLCETDRSESFCAHAINQEEVFVVEDTTLDARFVDNPLVTSDPNIRFYAGYPIRSEDGYSIGTLCIIDSKPRRFDKDSRSRLRDFAQVVEVQIVERNKEAE